MPKNTNRLSSLKDVSLRSGASRVHDPETYTIFYKLKQFLRKIIKLGRKKLFRMRKIERIIGALEVSFFWALFKQFTRDAYIEIPPWLPPSFPSPKTLYSCQQLPAPMKTQANGGLLCSLTQATVIQLTSFLFIKKIKLRNIPEFLFLPKHCFLNFSVHQNHVEGLLKLRFTGSQTIVLIQLVWDGSWDFWLSNKVQISDAGAAGLGHTLRTTKLA